MFSAILSAIGGLLSSNSSRLRAAAVGLLIGAAVAGTAAWHVQGARIDKIKALQLQRDAAAAAAQAQAKKATQIIEEQYEQTLKDAAAVARSNDAVIERLRAKAAAAGRRTTCGPDESARFSRLADSAAAIAGWAGDCSRRVSELEAQLVAIQSWIRVNM